MVDYQQLYNRVKENPKKHLSYFFGREIWDQNKHPSDSPLGMLYYLFRIGSLVQSGFAKNNIFVRAAALCYSSLLALGPLFVLMILVAGFALGRVEETSLTTFLNKAVTFAAPSLSEYTVEENESGTATTLAEQLISTDLISTLNEFIENAKRGTVGVIGILVLIVIAIQLFTAIEKTFNEIWGVRRGRSWLNRVLSYWTFLSLGALLSFGSIAVYSAGTYVQVVENLPMGAQILKLLAWMAPLLAFLLITLLLVFFYKFIPNTHVFLWPALFGSIVVTTLLFANNYFSFLYVSYVIRAQSLYGSLSIIPVLMLALYIFWTFILIGGQITYAIQNANYLTNQQAWQNTSQGTKELLNLATLVLIGRRFKDCKEAYSATDIGKTLRVPGQILNEALINLQDMGFVCSLKVEGEQGDDNLRYQPAKPLEKISLYNFKKSLETYGNTAGLELIRDSDPIVSLFSKETDRLNQDQWSSKNLSEWIDSHPVEAAPSPKS